MTHSQGPFPNAGYVDFDGSGDYLVPPNSSDFDLSGDWTVEAWVYITGGNGVLFSSQTTENIQFLRFNSSDGAIAFYGRDYGTGTSYFTNTGSFTNNEWFHVACSCSSGTMKLYVDGTQVDTASFGLTSTRLSVIGAFYYQGSHYTADPMYFNGYISNLRMVKGTALYTSNFTPPKGPLENISNTTLLTCQGSSITDASDSSHSISVTGNAAAVYNSQSHFHFDGSNDYVREDTVLDTITATTDPWSVECWFNTDANPSVFECMIGINYNNGAENTLLLGVRDDGGTCKVAFYYRNLEIGNFGTVTVGQWHHVVATHTSGSLKVYLDGTQIASNSNTVNQTLNTCAFLIGAELDGTNTLGNYFDGKISNVKMYNKTLTVSEIQQNFNAYRGRYEI